jgi:hypothetical protein
LWYAEREAFLSLGTPLSGARFVKRQHGPVPAAILPVLAELESERALVVRDFTSYGRAQREFISITEPDISGFRPEEISIINSVIYSICQFHTASSISEKSHDEVWELAAIGEELPLFTAFSVPGEIDESDIEWATQEINRIESTQA